MVQPAELFALDIGTRTVIGLVGRVEDNRLMVDSVEIREHNNRSMIDGQIHDITQVARVVSEVKESLEKKTSKKLHKVSVAAAGRALKTWKSSAEQQYSITQQLTRNDVTALEIQAVQNALKEIIEQDSRQNRSYHCVGYSVTRYTLQGDTITSLVGQRGSTAGVEVIATFLPRVVVDSLYAVLGDVGLELASLTLEPIAAGHVVIPDDMRRLNLVLLDVGAGTTDIAVSASGTLIGFDMVPSAGDEITEAICQEFLADFKTGESIKRRTGKGKEITFTDVLGNSLTVTPEQVAACYAHVIEQLGASIKEKILSINGRLPQAVICVGGGSLTYKFVDILAASLDMPADKIAVKGRDSLPNVVGGKRLQGPEAVTPIGIALSSQVNQALQFCKVQVNGTPVTLFNTAQSTAAEALLSSGMRLSEIYGKPGAGLTVEVNGEVTFIRGEAGKPAEILINGERGSLDSKINYGDDIQIVPGHNGSEARARVYDAVEIPAAKKITVNGQEYVLDAVIKVNGTKASPDQVINDKDRVSVQTFDSVQDVLEALNITADTTVILLNDCECGLDERVSDGDRLDIQPHKGFEVSVNGENITLETPKKTPIFSDVFPVVNFDFHKKGNKKLVMKLNGKPATFTQPLSEGDRIVLEWK